MAKDKDGKIIDLHEKKVARTDKKIEEQDPQYVIALRIGEQGIAQAIDQHEENFDLLAVTFAGIEEVVNPTQILSAGEPTAMLVTKFLLIFRKKEEVLHPLKRI